MPFISGVGLGLSLIIAIGAQNAYVLRQGIRREHVFLIAAICAVSDAALIALGVSGIGFALQAVPWLLTVVRWVGVVFLVGYGILALRRAIRSSGATLEAQDAPTRGGTAVRTRTVTGAVLTVLALTWLNPHVYLDTVFLLGSIAQTHGDGRWLFAVGAMCASFVWFFALAYGARFLSRWLATPKAWRIMDGVIAVIMFGIALSLALGS